jgi:hypothetical protein
VEKKNLKTTARLLGIHPECLRGGLNLVEAADLLGLSPSGLRNMAFRGDIAYQRYGRRWSFKWWHMFEFLEEHEYPQKNDGIDTLPVREAKSKEEIFEEAKSLNLI